MVSPTTRESYSPLSEASHKIQSQDLQSQEDDKFVKGMSEMFHLDDQAIAKRRQELKKQREGKDELEKHPLAQLRLEPLPETFDVSWPSKLKPQEQTLYSRHKV